MRPLRQHRDNDQPLVQRTSRTVEDASNLRAELLMILDTLALPLPLILEEHNVIASASWTGHVVIGPAQMDHIVKRVVRVAKVLNGLLKGTWVFHSEPRIPVGD